MSLRHHSSSHVSFYISLFLQIYTHTHNYYYSLATLLLLLILEPTYLLFDATDVSKYNLRHFAQPSLDQSVKLLLAFAPAATVQLVVAVAVVVQQQSREILGQRIGLVLIFPPSTPAPFVRFCINKCCHSQYTVPAPCSSRKEWHKENNKRKKK